MRIFRRNRVTIQCLAGLTRESSRELLHHWCGEMPVVPLREGLTVRLDEAADGQSRQGGGPGAAMGSRSAEQGIGQGRARTPWNPGASGWRQGRASPDAPAPPRRPSFPQRAAFAMSGPARRRRRNSFGNRVTNRGLAGLHCESSQGPSRSLGADVLADGLVERVELLLMGSRRSARGSGAAAGGPRRIAPPGGQRPGRCTLRDASGNGWADPLEASRTLRIRPASPLGRRASLRERLPGLLPMERGRAGSERRRGRVAILTRPNPFFISRERSPLQAFLR